VKLNIFYILVLSAFIISCNDSKKNKHLEDIAIMETTLDSLSIIAYDTTRENSTEITSSIKESILKIKNNFGTDTIDYVLAEKINAYKEIRTVISINSGNLAKVKQVIPEVQKKLIDLKHDIENGINDRDKYTEFIDFEKSKVNEVKSVLSYYLKTSDEYFKKYDSLHPIIKNLGDSLEQVSHE